MKQTHLCYIKRTGVGLNFLCQLYECSNLAFKAISLYVNKNPRPKSCP